jgi:Gryzun, putative trafficking through Golgi
VFPKPPKVNLSTSLHGPAYTGEKLPILITLENSETEVVALKIQYEVSESEEPEEAPFSWETPSRETTSSKELDLGDISPAEQRTCTIRFSAPSTPTECSLTLLIKYFLHSDPKTEVIKRALLDVPVIQPFQATFEIVSLLGEGMPDFFGEEELCVRQEWRVMTAISRIGAEVLELKDIVMVDTSDTAGVELKTEDEVGGVSGMMSRVLAECSS